MTPDEFRRRGREVIDMIADYWTRVEHRPVLSRVKPGQIGDMLPPGPPERGEPWESILADIERVVMPGTTHWQSPNFFAYFPANGSFPAILGDLLSAGLGVQGMLWATSPACTEVETRVLDWAADMLGLPATYQSRSTGGGVIQGTASEAALVSIVAARRRALAKLGDSADPSRLVLHTSTQAHSSIVKGAMVAGLADHAEDRRRIRLIDVDETYAMRPDLLERSIETDLAAGLVPFYLCATLGTTSSTAVDPLEALGTIARRHGLWLHADAAYAGSALVCPEHRWMIRGVEHADSFCFNPHKWLLTNFDCCCLWTADRRAVIEALSITPEYLRNKATQSGSVFDYRDWQIPLGRRFRALKLWFVIRHYGVEGLRAHIRGHIRLAELFETMVRTDDRFEIAAPRTLSLVCFRLRGEGPAADDRNRMLLERINASGKAYLTHTVLPGIDPGDAGARDRYVLRMAIGATQVVERHVRGAWDVIRESASGV